MINARDLKNVSHSILTTAANHRLSQILRVRLNRAAWALLILVIKVQEPIGMLRLMMRIVIVIVTVKETFGRKFEAILLSHIEVSTGDTFPFFCIMFGLLVL